jgi:two-component system NtrC family sensor kinase
MDEAEQLQQKIFLATGWLAGVGVLAMAVLGYLIARSITLPVEELAALTGKIAAGDFNQRATVRHHDEVGALAQSFNQMLSQMQSYEQKLIESEKIGTAGQMAAGLAHEIRNPLTSIKLFIQILQGRLQDQPDNQAMTGAILQEVCRLERIIEQIVARARPSAPVMIRGNINDPLNEVLLLAAPSLQAAGITVQNHQDEPLPSCLHDPEKVKQVFWNLLLNSKDAMPKGGRLEIFSTVTADGIDITFADSGCGLSDSNPDLCFKAFYTTKPEGLGLGLSTSRKIIEQHGGTLTVSNGEQGGVIASIHLPIGATPENS